METIPPAQTEREIAFLTRFLPQPSYTMILDLCCGEGRHARWLASRGYRVMGLDRDERAIEIARREASSAQFIVGDMRNVHDLHGNFDAVLCLWQSFGHFDDATNADIVKQISEKLVPRGRLILDIYHRDFFAAHQGTRVVKRDHRVITERKWMSGSRLTVELDYGDGRVTDRFEWQLYTPDEIHQVGVRFGFNVLIACADYHELKPPTPELARMQIVFEKR